MIQADGTAVSYDTVDEKHLIRFRGYNGIFAAQEFPVFLRELPQKPVTDVVPIHGN
jgi:hypothetical protein